MPLTDEQVIEQRLDLEMLERPHLWPGSVKGLRCVYLKRRRPGLPSDLPAWNETGPCILWGTDPDEYVVGGHGWHMEVAVYHYDSPDAILADGWVVD